MGSSVNRPSPALIVSVVALVFALSGAAIALPGKNSVTKNDIKKNAVTKRAIKNGAVVEKKIADAAVTSAKIASDAVTSGKIADAAVGTDKIADSAVTSAKLDEAERSQAFTAETTGVTAADLPNGVVGSYSTGDAVMLTMTLDPGLYLVTGKAEMIDSDVGTPDENTAICRVLDDGVSVAEAASGVIDTLALFPGGSASPSGIVDGGEITLGCRAADTGIFGFGRTLIATRLGSVSP